MAAFIAYGAATPNAIVAASSPHHGRRPLRSVLSESTGGGKNYLPFHQPHSGDFMPYANHQQIWPVEIARGAATPNAIVAASYQHHGRRPLRSVSSESIVGASNWGCSAGVIKKRF